MAHTEKSLQNSSFQLHSSMSKKISVLLFIGFLAWAYQAIQPPPPKICGSANGPSVTAPRIKLRDGRHLAYKENGVPKDKAKYNVIFVHGFDSCRYDVIRLSQETAEELGIYLVSFDRAGYGESDPNPKRTVKDTALDIEELADQLGMGSKFYVVGFSMGGQVIWTCLKYIPHRLAGATLIAPVVNYWWPGFPANLSKKAYKQQLPADRWAVGVAHYAPWLTYWWNTQKWFPCSNVIAHSPDILNTQDKELFSKFESREAYGAQIRQQGEFETLHRDMIVGFGRWEFDPMELENPFPNNEGSVHLWHGDEDGLVPVILQRYIAEKLPWIHYHELKGSGHMLHYIDAMPDTIINTMLVGLK
ncbi:PREDICTED: uncharacterized protein LOC104588412 [Nelumbo nucifera]|uniref:AB hydrolase-1 domain-containing protein n=2 Tax=Nelumbo nucifera TaxID=4432 RepID=A0A822ZVP8_NELNU|nr:PREDICTED: uncharacterized protein LOC104588412 [Nelumbo nucifera]DAD48570.1 TPA_asm: hypothetical protein HUJ06_018507 [Nelumbo nucifera]